VDAATPDAGAASASRRTSSEKTTAARFITIGIGPGSMLL
jgi:hypothetical protein